MASRPRRLTGSPQPRALRPASARQDCRLRWGGLRCSCAWARDPSWEACVHACEPACTGSCDGHRAACPDRSRPCRRRGCPPTGAIPPTLRQVDELRELTVLAKDAASILWEMVSLQESGSAAEEMKSTAKQLQVRAQFMYCLVCLIVGRERGEVWWLVDFVHPARSHCCGPWGKVQRGGGE